MRQEVAERSGIVAEPCAGTIGARISGVDVRSVQPPAVAEELTGLLHEHGVLFFSTGTPITDDEHKQFASTFGELSQHLHSANDADPFFITIDSAITPSKDYQTCRWHTDGPAEECPPQAALLRCVKLPSVGGDTMWASMYAAYESLSSHFQRLLDGLEALHSTALASAKLPKDFAIHGEAHEATHPVVLRDEVTGRRMLYVNSNYTARILGLTDTESEKVLAMLFEHVNTPELHVRLRWEPDTVAVWEERVTQHRLVADHAEQRIMKRLTISGKRPVA
jgi:taurine dioxygenase